MRKVATLLSALTVWGAVWCVGMAQCPNLGGNFHRFLPPARCDLRGTWIGSLPPFLPELGDQTAIVAATITPLDIFSCQLNASLHPFNPEFTFGGAFPQATAGSPNSYGVYRRVDRDNYEVTLRSYFVKAPAEGVPIRGQVQYWTVIRGTAECVDSDTQRLNAVFSLYSNVDDPDLVIPPLGIDGVHDQDGDDDGFEDPGEAPIFSGLLPIIFKRVTVEAPPS